MLQDVTDTHLVPQSYVFAAACNCRGFKSTSRNTRQTLAPNTHSALGCESVRPKQLDRVLTRPGLEPGISGSGGRRLIHWANGPFGDALGQSDLSAQGRRVQNLIAMQELLGAGAIWFPAPPTTNEHTALNLITQ